MKINSRKVLPFLYLFPAILILGVFVYTLLSKISIISFFDLVSFQTGQSLCGVGIL